MKRTFIAFLSLLITLTCQAEGVVEIDNPATYQKILALSDAHGMYKPLKALLLGNRVINRKQQWTAGRTLLIVVGDSIDKGPDSLDILDLWISLAPQAEKAGGKLLVLLGNHEAAFLAAPEDDAKAEALYDEMKKKNIPVREVSDPSFPKGRFLRSLPLAAKVGRWFFSHSGLYPTQGWTDFKTQAELLLKQGHYSNELFTGRDSVLEAKGWWDDASTRSAALHRMAKAGMYGAVFGHQPKALGVKKKIASVNEGRFIKIDTGMAPESGSHDGRMLEFSNPADLLAEKPAKVSSLDQNGNRQEVTEGG
jgi:hypothetical protein